MKITTNNIEGALVLSLFGELDHHAAREAIPQITKKIETELPMKLILDFEGINFMDSSGIALAIGAYKRICSIGGNFSIINASLQTYKVFDAAGICNIIQIEKRNYNKVKI